jgi:hypothetical protein
VGLSGPIIIIATYIEDLSTPIVAEVHQVMLGGPSCSGQQLRHMPGGTGREQRRQRWEGGATQWLFVGRLSGCLVVKNGDLYSGIQGF